jgi:NAD(P)-dependent dehydrogenase (short-subunit alcohol dehydrogenase family)
MISFTRTMALELAGHQVRVNAIAPDHTVTPGARGNRVGAVNPDSWPRQTAEQREAWAQLIPLGREGVDEECGRVAVFLASRMSEYVTGAVIPVDGGTSASGGWFRSREGGWTLVDGLRFGR